MVRVQVTVPPSQDPASVTVTVKHGSVVTIEVPPKRGGSISSRISMDTPREHIGSKYDYTLSGAAPVIPPQPWESNNHAEEPRGCDGVALCGRSDSAVGETRSMLDHIGSALPPVAQSILKEVSRRYTDTRESHRTREAVVPRDTPREQTPEEKEQRLNQYSIEAAYESYSGTTRLDDGSRNSLTDVRNEYGRSEGGNSSIRNEHDGSAGLRTSMRSEYGRRSTQLDRELRARQVTTVQTYGDSDIAPSPPPPQPRRDPFRSGSSTNEELPSAMQLRSQQQGLRGGADTLTGGRQAFAATNPGVPWGEPDDTGYQ